MADKPLSGTLRAFLKREIEKQVHESVATELEKAIVGCRPITTIVADKLQPERAVALELTPSEKGRLTDVLMRASARAGSELRRGLSFVTLPVTPEPASSATAYYLISTQDLNYRNAWTAEEWNDPPGGVELPEAESAEASSEAPDPGQGGARFRDAVWASDEMLGSDEAARRVNLSREGLNQQRRANKILGLTASKRGVRYPEWQFEDAVRPHMPELLSALAHLDAWGHYLFLTQPEPLLRGDTPLNVLRQHKPSEVLRVARLLADEAAGV